MKIRIAIAQVNPTVGDLDGNVERIMSAYDDATRQGADLMVAPECVLTGYPLEDLVSRDSFMTAVNAAREALVARVVASGSRTAIVFGAPCSGAYHDGVHNSAFIVDPTSDGTWPGRDMTHKSELPNYGPFDEKRTFVPGHEPAPWSWRGRTIGVMICEDAWFPRVSATLSAHGAELLIAINGSPFEIGKDQVRRDVVEDRVRETGRPFLYVNLVGGQDELVFDGGSFAHDGRTITQFPSFQEGVWIHEHDFEAHANGKADRIDSDLMEGMDEMLDHEDHRARTAPAPVPDQGIGPTYRACVLGLRDYLRKQGFEKGVVLGMSGGVDSGIVAAMACDAIGPAAVTLVRLPSRFSSAGSLVDAEAAAARLGVTDLRTVPIEGVVDALRGAYAGATGHPLTGIADENVQARARGTILMAISNQEGRIVLSTGNKSEVSVGYSTLYGDMCGGFNPIKDLYKSTVWDCCRWRNSLDSATLADMGLLGREAVVVPEEIIVKPPSAELREGQADSDSLPPYEVLDDVLQTLIERRGSQADAVARGHDPATVARVGRLLDVAEYKRRQAAPGVKVTGMLHGRDRRVPIVNAWRG